VSDAISVVPAARRLMESLRELGYSFPAAIADLVDNSVDAGATRIDITLRFSGASSWVRVSDDGRGMTPVVLDEAMRYGSRRDYAAGDQGKYGLGLKTASLSQCRSLTVATRVSPQRRRLHIRRWSLDHVAATDAWEVLRLTPDDVPPEAVSPLDDHIGTVVFWEQLDRLLRYRRPDGGAAENGLASRALEVSQHLGMVFHRFIAGEVSGARAIELTVNGDPVAAWDPFARSEPETRSLPPQNLRIETRNGPRTVATRSFILPREDRFSSRHAHTRAGGPNRWNRQQGLYIYRANRLIQSGGWNRLRAEDEHTKLARISLDIPPGCDELFQINVSKMRVTLPADLRSMLKAMVTGVAATAQDAYRRGERDRSPLAAAQPGSGESQNGRVLGVFSESASSGGAFDRRLGVYWPELERVLVEELAEQPQLLSRVLRRLSRVATHDAPAADVVSPVGPGKLAFEPVETDV
jgi:Histidine kinase-, DNA gyrase B-, and HSP90-like ATPase